MKYLGNKTRILDFIEQSLIKENIDYKKIKVADLFSGTGSVSNFFLKNDCNVSSCDNLLACVCEQYRINYFKSEPSFDEIGFDSLKNLLDYLNNLKPKKGYFYDNYAPSGKEHRQYFSNINAMKIDSIREKIDSWKDSLNKEKYYFLIGILMNAADRVSNTSGTYGAYLKIWRSMALKELILETPNFIETGQINIQQNDVINFVTLNKGFDIVYIDPPYNERQYASNFHVLESICQYDKQKLKGKTGLREYDNLKSKFCLKRYATDELDLLINKCDSKTIILSYSTEGIINEEDILSILSKKGKTSVYRHNYRRFKTNSHTNGNTGLCELLFVCKTY